MFYGFLNVGKFIRSLVREKVDGILRLWFCNSAAKKQKVNKTAVETFKVFGNNTAIRVEVKT